MDERLCGGGDEREASGAQSRDDDLVGRVVARRAVAYRQIAPAGLRLVERDIGVLQQVVFSQFVSVVAPMLAVTRTRPPGVSISAAAIALRNRSARAKAASSGVSGRMTANS
jgi:hypothetical protein